MALEALIAELPGTDLDAWREPVAAAANEALRGPVQGMSLEDAVAAMETALRRRRLGRL